MQSRIRMKAGLLRISVAAAMATCGLAVQAQSATATAATEIAAGAAGPLGLRQIFDAAWARQPEALALQARRDAARAQQKAASAWTPAPAVAELSNKTDRLNRNQGSRELEVGVAVPLWLPGERSRSAALADAENTAVESRTAAAQLRVAASVREAWWAWQRAQIEADSARAQLDNSQRIAADVVNRKMQEGSSQRSMKGQFTRLPLPKNIAVMQDGLHFFYNANERAAYNLAVYDFIVPYSEIRAFIRLDVLGISFQP